MFAIFLDIFKMFETDAYHAIEMEVSAFLCAEPSAITYGQPQGIRSNVCFLVIVIFFMLLKCFIFYFQNFICQKCPFTNWATIHWMYF